MRLRSASALSLVLLASGAGETRAELLAAPEPVPDRPLRLTFEILPAEPDQRLPDEILEIEGARFYVDETLVSGTRYVRSSVIFPLPSGDRLERICLFADEGGKLRMLGLHALRRHLETPDGETLVFRSGAPNPLNGRGVDVPADTYTYLGLAAALRGVAADPKGLQIHVWLGDGRGTQAAAVVAEGEEELALFGTKVQSRRFHLKVRGAEAGDAIYWFSASRPHAFLQYRGPADFLPGREGSPPRVLLRATSSSEQTQELFGSSASLAPRS